MMPALSMHMAAIQRVPGLRVGSANALASEGTALLGTALSGTSVFTTEVWHALGRRTRYGTRNVDDTDATLPPKSTAFSCSHSSVPLSRGTKVYSN